MTKSRIRTSRRGCGAIDGKVTRHDAPRSRRAQGRAQGREEVPALARAGGARRVLRTRGRRRGRRLHAVGRDGAHAPRGRDPFPRSRARDRGRRRGRATRVGSRRARGGASAVMEASAIPGELRVMPQWFRWKSVPNEPKPRKIPVHPSDPGCASSTDPATWGSFEDAQANVGNHGTCGLGFTFTKSDPFFGADLDNCVVNRVVTDRAKVIVAAFETYTEISPSGEGLHLIGRGSLNGHRGINRKTETGIELYDTGRYFTMTGAHLMGTPPEITDGQRALDALIATLDPPRPVTPPSRPRPQTSADHGRIVERARSYVPTINRK